MSLVGQVFSNRYRIERELAQGGMAEVYLARDELLDRPVALKVLFPEFAREPSFVERFRREAQAAANLNHPNIVAIYDWGQESGTYFIVMEHVEGRSLRQLIRDDGPLEPGVAADIAAEIASALAFAHRNGVVHRDVKPGNVLLTRAGNVKVTDFGIARAGASDGLTQTGSVMGTATYFSPEQAQGLPVDGRSDVYAVGVVLYEMVCGVPPFTGDSPVSVAYKHVREDAVLPSQRNPDVPAGLEQIIMSALAKDSDQRYQSADDLRADILRFRRGRPLSAAPITAVVAEVPTTALARVGPESYAPAATIASPRVAVEPTQVYDRPPARRRHPAAFTLLTLLVLAALIGGVLFAATRLGSSQATVVIPDVHGKTLAQAGQILVQRHLEYVTQDVQSPTVAAGKVVKTIPGANQSVKRGTTVTLQVSAGVGTKIVPDVTNQTVANAKKLLQAQHFDVVVDPPQSSSTVPPGNVINTNPPANQDVAKGSTIHIVPSDGVTIPNVANLTQQQAFAQITDAGLLVKLSTESSDTVAAGNVTRTSPAIGTKVAGGSTVTVFVSTGSKTVTVPPVEGLPLLDAVRQLHRLNLRTSTVLQQSSQGNSGKVIAQNPPSGSAVAPGSLVVLTVGEFTAPSTTAATTTTTTVPPGP